MEAKELEDLLRRHREAIARARAVVEESRRIRAARRQEPQRARLKSKVLREQAEIRIERSNSVLSNASDSDGDQEHETDMVKLSGT